MVWHGPLNPANANDERHHNQYAGPDINMNRVEERRKMRLHPKQAGDPHQIGRQNDDHPGEDTGNLSTERGWKRQHRRAIERSTLKTGTAGFDGDSSTIRQDAYAGYMALLTQPEKQRPGKPGALTQPGRKHGIPSRQQRETKKTEGKPREFEGKPEHGAFVRPPGAKTILERLFRVRFLAIRS